MTVLATTVLQCDLLAFLGTASPSKRCGFCVLHRPDHVTVYPHSVHRGLTVKTEILLHVRKHKVFLQFLVRNSVA